MKWMLIAIVTIYALTTHSQSLLIQNAGNDGRLSFSGALLGTTATVEWAASLTEPGRTNWRALTNVIVSGSVVTSDIPMFFRVRGVPIPTTSITNARFFASGNNFHNIRHNGSMLTTADRVSLHVAITNVAVGDIITVHLRDRFDIMSLWLLAQTETGVNLFEVGTNWTGYLPVSTSQWWNVIGAITSPAQICPTNREYTDLVRTQASFTPNYSGLAPTIYSPLAGPGQYENAYLYFVVTTNSLNP